MITFSKQVFAAGTAGLILVCATTASAADWPQWRGPDRNDQSPDSGLLKKWASAPKLVWLFKDAGLGYSGCSIVAGKLYTMGARNSTEYLIALDAKTGKEAWSIPVGERLGNRWGDGPRGTPTVSGKYVLAMGGAGDVICAMAEDGRVVWKSSMKDLGGQVPGWGYCESVLVEGGQVVCTPGGSKGTLAALDLATGRLAWQSAEVTDGAQYSSIVPADINGKRQLVQLLMNKLFAVEPSTGKRLWETPWSGRTAVIPTPIHHQNHVYITSGYGAGSKLVKIGADNSVEIVYENKVMKNHHGGVILVGSHLYGYSDGPGWVCQNFFTGEEIWANKSLGKGAVHYADGMLYCLEEDSGTVALVSASPAGWKENGRFKLDPQTQQRSPQGRVWTHPLVLDGKMYLRDQELLFCFDVSR